MNKKTFVSVVVIGALSLCGVVFSGALARAGHSADHGGDMAGMHMEQPAKTDVLSIESVHSMHVPMVLMSIDKAKKALAAGDNKTASAELDKAQNMLVVIQAALAKHVKPQFANTLCPIMGSPINPEKITKELTREFKGKKVAFCCAGCPARWDTLTLAQKQNLLTQAISRSMQHNPMHKH